jgi:hypothetical protein
MKSPRDQIRGKDVELSVNAGFLEHWKAYTTVLNYRDKLFPVRIIINARTVSTRNRKGTDGRRYVRNMVYVGAGKFEASNKMVKCMARFLNRQNGSNLEEVIATDMDAVKAAVLSEGSSFKLCIQCVRLFWFRKNANFDPQSR